MIKSFVYDGRTVTVDLTPLPDGRIRASIEDREYIFAPQTLPDGGVVLSLNGERHTAYTAVQGTDQQVAVDGMVYSLSAPEARGSEGRTGRRRGSPGSGDLTAQMPGQVREVLVEEAASVQRGQTILLLEAMKMEIRVTAPSAGVVKRLLVKAGDVVERGQLLAEIAGAE